MNDASYLRRFPALHKAEGKLRRLAAPPLGFDVEEDFVAPPKTSEVRTRIVASEAGQIAWVGADTGSAERRAQQLARVRAERELSQERERISRQVMEMRQAKAETGVRQSRSAVEAMEDRLLRGGGYTGRLGWMESQVVKSRGMVSQA